MSIREQNRQIPEERASEDPCEELLVKIFTLAREARAAREAREVSRAHPTDSAE